MFAGSGQPQAQTCKGNLTWEIQLIATSAGEWIAFYESLQNVFQSILPLYFDDCSSSNITIRIPQITMA